MDRDKLVIPRHIAIIMDGNGRWAKERGKIRLEGHRAGARTLEKILKYAGEIGVKYLTVYAFSTENWKRPQKEVNGLMDLFGKYLDKEKKNLKKQGVKLAVTGEKENISPKLLKKIEDTQKFLEDCDRITFNIAFNYGGRREIVSAVNKILDENKTKKLETITEEEFSRYMYRPEIPDPELVIRTSGEFRISNFLLWEIAYSEFYITNVYWPDFDENLFNLIFSSAIKKVKEFHYQITGYDKAPSAVAKAKDNLKNANLADYISVFQKDFFSTEKEDKQKPLHIVFNPPYNERLQADIEQLYGQIGNTLKHHYPNSEAWFITSNLEGKYVGLRPSRKIKLYNGKLESRLLQFKMYEGSKKTMAVTDEGLKLH